MAQPRCALVTGASSGIGEAVARLLAHEGYRVALLARRADALEAVRSSLPAGEHAGHVALAADLCDPASIRAACERVGRELGTVDLLVNNAGMGYRARVCELDDALLRQVIDTNVTGLLVMCREALPLLRRGTKPVVVNVSSVVGRRGIPGQSAYSATKAAVCSIGEALRVEWAEHGIAVCTLCPALTTTGFFDAQPNPAGLPAPDLSRSASAADVARAVLALDRTPRPEVSLRWKWRLLGMISPFAPRLADRMLVKRLGGGWQAPRF